jgi:hypothetical protein
LGIFVVRQDSRFRIAGKFRSSPRNVPARASLNAFCPRRISFLQLLQSLSQARCIQNADRERAQATLRASGTASEPLPCLSRSIGKRSIDDLH